MRMQPSDKRFVKNQKRAAGAPVADLVEVQRAKRDELAAEAVVHIFRDLFIKIKKAGN